MVSGTNNINPLIIDYKLKTEVQTFIYTKKALVSVKFVKVCGTHDFEELGALTKFQRDI